MKKIIFFILSLISVIVLSSCSTTKEIQKVEQKEKPKETHIVIPVKKAVRNNPLEERENIKIYRIESIDKLRFDYDNKGTLRNKGKLSFTKYDEKGLMLESQFYDDKGKVDYKYEYKYDKKLNLIETKRYNKKGNLDKRYSYEYNKDGNKSKVYRYNQKDIFDKYYIYIYDELGNLLKEEWYDKSGKLEFTIVNIYEDDKIKETLNYEGKTKLSVKYLFKYDSNNNVTEEIKYNADGARIGVIQYLYKYKQK